MRLDLSAPDLYTALAIERNAHEDTIREYIGALYREALANADHRDPAMRCYYSELLQVLPRGYSIFLDAAKRARYNSYLQARDEGYAESFEQFSTAAGQSNNTNLRDREGLLSIRNSAPMEPAAAVLNGSALAAEYSAPTQEYSGTEELLPEKPVSPTSQSLPFLAGFGCGLVALAAARGAFHWPLQNALLLSAGVTISVFLVLYLRLRSSS